LEISSLSDYDYALINATWLSLTNEDFQCSRVESMYEKRSDAEVQIKIRRIQKGCGVISNSPKIEIGRIAYHSCLCHQNFQHPLIGHLMSLSANYEKGNLPFSGAVMDQPAQIMEIIELIEHLKMEREAELQAKAAKNSPKKGR
jgi:hypothetical protein